MGKVLAWICTAAVSLSFASPSLAKVLAQCGASNGQSYYDKQNAWIDDGISGGIFMFVVDEKGNPNIFFRSDYVELTNATAVGAKILFSFIHPELEEFGLVAIYGDIGQVETYNIFRSADGKRKLFWTSNKSKALPLVTKVAAYVAECQ